jgi:carbon-monoxide dehydrogenase large subunit
MTGSFGAGARFIGQRIARREDARLVTGHGTYVDDVSVPGVLHAAFVRSNAARGQIVSVEADAARSLPGVVAVLTSADINHLVKESWLDYEGGPPANGDRVPFRPLAEHDVRFVGEPIVLVVAESRYVAEDACELVEVEIDPEPPVLDMEQALADGGPIVHPELGTNLAGALPGDPDPELDRVFEQAPHVITETFRQHRYLCVPMETRGIVAKWDPYRQDLNVWISTQGPHGVRSYLARVLGIPDTRVRVVMQDVGGGFGQKMFMLADEVAVVLASQRLGRPVKWIEDRRENLMVGQHAREDQVTVSFALDDDGHILGARTDHLENVGSYPAGGSSSLVFAGMIFPGPYRIANYRPSGRAAYTNTCGRCSYRGPWMIETVVREQMMDTVARQLGIDPLELRRRNVIRSEDLPYTTATGFVYDSISADQTLEQAGDMLGYSALRRQQDERRRQGRLVGIGLSLYMEPSGIAMGSLSSEGAIVRIGVNGQADVAMSSGSHGQSVETTVAQVVADHLGLDIDAVTVLQGDTAATPYGPGTGGSRSAVLCSGAASRAAEEVRAKMLQIAAHALEAAPEDLDVSGGYISVAGTPTHGVTVAEVARMAYLRPDALPPGMDLGLEAYARYTPATPVTWSNSCHACLCEVDRITGEVTIERYIVSEDCGVMINPNVVEGQIAGGVAQGIGGVLYEHMKYDDDGNPMTTTFVDYLLPTAAEVPIIEYGHVETRATSNPGGYKGLGEGGAIGSPPAVINAIADALAPLGAHVTSQPLGPADIVALIQAAETRAAASSAQP